MEMHEIDRCPICDSKKHTPFLKCIDYMVSRETFQIVTCDSCEFRYTNSAPDLNELGKYNESDNTLAQNSKGLIRNYIFIKRLKLISKFYRTGNLLDIGCGKGEFLNICNQAKWNVIGVDSNEQNRENARKNFSFEVRGLEEIIKLKDSSFEIITMWHSLESIPNLRETVNELKRLLKPKGVIIVSVSNCDSLDAKLYREYWSAYNVPKHLYHFTPKHIENLFKQFDLKVFNVLPEIFDSFYVSLLSEQYKSGKTKFIRSMWNGLYSNFCAMKTGREYSSQIYLIKKS